MSGAACGRAPSSSSSSSSWRLLLVCVTAACGVRSAMGVCAPFQADQLSYHTQFTGLQAALPPGLWCKVCQGSMRGEVCAEQAPSDVRQHRAACVGARAGPGRYPQHSRKPGARRPVRQRLFDRRIRRHRSVQGGFFRGCARIARVSPTPWHPPPPPRPKQMTD